MVQFGVAQEGAVLLRVQGGKVRVQHSFKGAAQLNKVQHSFKGSSIPYITNISIILEIFLLYVYLKICNEAIKIQ
jgi:hypothetical protein